MSKIRQGMTMKNALAQEEEEEECQCPLSYAMSLIGGKWKTIVLHYLGNGAMRFGALRRAMPKTTQRMLTLTLRELEADGLVHRKVFEVVPPHVEYSLTFLGKELAPVMDSLTVWGEFYYQNNSQSEPS